MIQYHRSIAVGENDMKNNNLEIMKKLLEEKKAKGKQKQGKIVPDRYGKQPAGSGNL